MEEVKSPCRSNCRYDYEKKICTGCYRNMDEIMVWYTLSNEEKELVLEKAENRKNRFNRQTNGAS